MSSEAQINANKQNAQASTGPRTPEGKAASSRNALKFGLTSEQVVLAHENQADFDDLHNGLVDHLKPATDAESLQVDNMAVAEWRERRVERAQKAWMAAELAKHPQEDRDVVLAAILLGNEVRKFQKYAAAYRREREAAWRKLCILQKERKLAEEALRETKLQIKAKWMADHPGKKFPELDDATLDRAVRSPKEFFDSLLKRI